MPGEGGECERTATPGRLVAHFTCITSTKVQILTPGARRIYQVKEAKVREQQLQDNRESLTLADRDAIFKSM